MSKAPKRGKLRNPPRGRQYAYVAIVVVLLLAGGSGAYLYATHSGPFYTTATSSSSSASSSSSGNSTSKSVSGSSTVSGAGFINTPCTESTTTSSQSTTGTYALICTNLGLIEVQLSSADAPKTVANFVSLAQSGFYNDLVWHRIVDSPTPFVIQAGDPNTKNGGGNRATWGSGTSGTSIPFEDDGNLHNTLGTIAMASTSPGTGGSSQFYINLADNSAALDGKYAVFGHVINGLSVMNALAKVPVNSSQQPISAASAYIVSVTIQSTP